MIRRVLPLGLLLALVSTLLLPAAPASAIGTKLSGAGSTYVGQAMSQWVSDGGRLGVQVDYQAVGSPTGLNFYTQGAQDFAGTEAEFTSIYGNAAVRSYQYVPDVAGATALMYNLKDAAGRKVDYLHLSPATVAAIFTGTITDWSDPRITAENLGKPFPSQPIHVILRSGASGTTALFYDFVAHAAPDLWKAFRARNQLSDAARVVSVPETAIKGSTGVGSSDAIAQYIKNDASGTGAIGYDEFGYAKFFGVPVAWMQNASGKWVQPYAANISAALDGATLRPDLSQELSSVYTSKNPLAYPASAYSYIALPCAPAADRPTCRDPAYDDGRVQAMAAWLDYIGCQGQSKMALLGYSPLPPVLSQEVQNSIARMSPTAPRARALTAANCANPRFSGSLGPGSVSPPDPFLKVDPTFNGGGAGAPAIASGPGAVTGGTPAGKTGTAGAGAATAAPSAAATAAATGGAGTAGSTDTGAAGQAEGAADTPVRALAPVAYRGADPDPLGPTPALALLVLVAGPPVVVAAWRRARRRTRA